MLAHIVYIAVTLVIGFGLGRLHNKAKVEATIAAAVAAAKKL